MQAEPGIQLFSCFGQNWIPGSIVDRPTMAPE
jgi:hypothetical protein